MISCYSLLTINYDDSVFLLLKKRFGLSVCIYLFGNNKIATAFYIYFGFFYCFTLDVIKIICSDIFSFGLSESLLSPKKYILIYS